MDLRSMKVLSLCAGIGGLDLGLRLAVPTSRTVCYVEREAFCIEDLVSSMEEGVLDDAPIWTDIKTFDGTRWRGSVDLITGGYPCQPFSVAGKKLGDKDPRHLWPDVARIVREVRPRWCFFENVGGHLRLGFREVRRELQEMGYEVTPGLFTAKEVTAPQNRERIFILADSGSSGRRNRSDHRQGRQVLHHQDGNAEKDKQEREGREYRVGKASKDVEIPNEPRSGSSDRDTGKQGRRRSADRRESVSEETGRDEKAPEFNDRTASEDVELFPPTPDQITKWKYVLNQEPSVEPAICRVADGVPIELDFARYRVDRLRALGNAVVPLTAAFAFSVLMNERQGV